MGNGYSSKLFTDGNTWLVVAIIVFAVTSAACSGYPTREDVDSSIATLASSEDEHAADDLKKLLGRLRETDSVADDRICKYAFDVLAADYNRRKDSRILDVMDATDSFGGFRNFQCGFYYNISTEPSFVIRYQESSNLPAIKRCSGIVFSPEEVDALAAGQNLQKGCDPR